MVSVVTGCVFFMDKAYFLPGPFWPALSWIKSWKRGQKQPLRSPMGSPHKQVTQREAPAEVRSSVLGRTEEEK